MNEESEGWLKSIEDKIRNMTPIEYCGFLCIVVGFCMLILLLGLMFGALSSAPTTEHHIESPSPVETESTRYESKSQDPVSPTQTIDIDVNPTQPTNPLPIHDSTLPFHQEINISGSNSTVTINNYDGNGK